MKLDINWSLDLAVIVTAWLFVFGNPAPAVADELDCGELANRLTAGDDYQIQPELETQKIRLEIGDDFCAEPAAAWFGRNIILPVPARRDIALPATALEAPLSEISASPAPGRGTEAVPLPGQKMRAGRLPDLGLDSGGKVFVPLPIQRADKIPQGGETVPPPAADQPGVTLPQEPGKTGQSGESVATASGVRVSGDPQGGAAKVTKYDAGAQNAASSHQTATVPGSPESKTPATTVPGSKSKSKSEPEPESPHVCDRELTDFWKAGEHMIDGQMTTLTGVFTVDLDNDGRVDNVGFKIGAKGRIGNVLSYFPIAKGRLSAQSVPTLKLEDDQDLQRLCSGDVTFKAMTSAEKQKAVGSAKRRQQELSSGAKPTGQGANADPETPVADQTEEEKAKLTREEKTENLLFWAIIIATVFFLLGGVGLFFAVRNMRSRDDEEYEDEDDDERK